jgi:LPS sulfotransferase NodH
MTTGARPTDGHRGVGRGYAVMTYARSGGTYLAQLLGSTGCLGQPEDWFNGKGYRDRGIAGYPLDREGQLAKVVSEGRSANGVFGVKLSPVRCDELRGFDWAGRLAPLAFIHLTREDRLGQAVSDSKAQQTQQYRSTSGAKGEGVYDGARIARSLDNQLRDEARARRFFAVNGITPLELTYERLLADEANVLTEIARLVGVDTTPIPDRGRIKLAVQRDATSEAWRRRFLAENGDLGQMPAVGYGAGWRRWLGR